MNGAKVPAEKLDTIIEATRLAPSGFGLTPYSIIVVEDEETRKFKEQFDLFEKQITDERGYLRQFPGKHDLHQKQNPTNH